MVWERRITHHHSSRRKKAENRIEHVAFSWTSLFFFVRMSGVQPLQFELTYPPGEEPDDSEEASGESNSELKESKNREHRLLHS